MLSFEDIAFKILMTNIRIYVTVPILYNKLKIFINIHLIFRYCCSFFYLLSKIGLQSLFRSLSLYIWLKVFKNGQSRICGRQPLKNLF